MIQVTLFVSSELGLSWIFGQMDPTNSKFLFSISPLFPALDPFPRTCPFSVIFFFPSSFRASRCFGMIFDSTIRKFILGVECWSIYFVLPLFQAIAIFSWEFGIVVLKRWYLKLFPYFALLPSVVILFSGAFFPLYFSHNWGKVLTSYLPFTPGIMFFMDIPGARHFLLLILTVIGVVSSRILRSLQQLNSMTSLWSLKTVPQLQLVTLVPSQAHCLVWT